MKDKYIYFFNEITRDNIDLVGGKGANLGELVGAGFPVPEGYCISVKAYKGIIGETCPQDDINKILDSVHWENFSDIEEKSFKIRELIIKESITGQLKDEIIGAYNQLGQADDPVGAAVAVRSSATAEDLPEASFAGQQETFLNIRGDQQVLESVKLCWASLWTARAMSYRHKRNYDQDKVYLSVIIQEMVKAEVAGVAFTMNPLNGKAEEILINSSYGLGEVVVSGLVTPDIFTLSKKPLDILGKQLGAKEKLLEMDQLGRTRLVDVTQEKREEYSLTDALVKKLGQLARKVEEHYRSPLDIEWALVNGKFLLLQARPITASGSGVTPEEGLIPDKLTKRQKFMLDDLIEHYPEAPTPLDYAVVILSYQALLDSASNLGFKISSAKEIVSLEREGRITLTPPGIRLTLNLFSAPVKLFKSAMNSSSVWQKEYLENIVPAITSLEALNMDEITKVDLSEQFEKIFSLAQRTCQIRFNNFMEANLLPLAGLSLVLKIFCSKNKRPHLTDLVTTGLNYKTAVIHQGLNRLAVDASADPRLKEAIMQAEKVSLNEIKAQLLQIPGGREFIDQLEEFLRIYGYRTEKMYQPFTGKAWLEDPEQLMVLIRAALQDPLLLDRKTNDIKRNKDHEEWLSSFKKKLKYPFSLLFNWSYESLRVNHMIREDTLFSLEMLFTAGRKIKKELGKRLAHAGYIEFPEDMVYLNREEIPRAISGQMEKVECRRLVGIRKKNYVLNQSLWKKTLLKLAEKNRGKDTVQGISGSPGLAEGPARVIMNVKDFGKLEKGDVLICPYTDPTWTPLFGMASAVVADTGGPLSHAAIVAREYSIPAVLGTKAATTFFEPGEIVIVDGSAGIVMRKNSRTR